MKKVKVIMSGLVLCILLCGISAQAGEQKYRTYDYGDTSGVLNEDYFKLDCYIYCDSGKGTGKTKGAVMGYKCRATVTVYDKNNNALGNDQNRHNSSCKRIKIGGKQRFKLPFSCKNS